jgi:hypothetical protein
MEGYDLVAAVQPEEGWYAVVGIADGKPPIQHLVETREEFDACVERLVKQKRNVFFGVAKYRTGENRTKDNVLALKALWLDIDCGKAKAEAEAGYKTKKIALQALNEFCEHVGLSQPTVVDSGGGLHVYWPLTEAVSREEWEPVAARLRELCALHGLRVDPVVFEVARILRVPRTLNFKRGEPREVAVCAVGDPVELGALRTTLGVKEVPAFAPRKASSFLGQKFAADDFVKSFDKIVKRTLTGDGCAQLDFCLRNVATLSEPLWRSALSIANFCEDKVAAVEALSAGHPDYDPQVTQRKLAGIPAPHSCVVFETNNPGHCSGCKHFGKIKSPISLGKVLPPGDPIVVEETVQTLTGEEETVKVTIPEYPFPFSRGPNGGIYMAPEGEEKEPIKVYPHDFYILKRMRDPQHGDVVVARVHLPHDGMREFVIPNDKIVEPSELRKVLSLQGVVVSNMAKFTKLHMFVLCSIENLQTGKRAEEMRLQFGWTDNDSKFIVGEKEFVPGAWYPSPASSQTRGFANHLRGVGTLEKWKEVFELYGRPGMEPVAFAALTAFGAPLFKFTGQHGAVINLINSHSGTGKTTALRMCNSVWGDPAPLLGTKKDTENARYFKLGVFNNLPVTNDEMTNLKLESLSELIYSVTEGKAKDRMKSSANELRLNASTWQTIMLCSSNSSFYEKLAVLKHGANAEALRILEYKVGFSGVVTQEEGKALFDHQLSENYGWAGPIYAQYLVENRDHLAKEVRELTMRLDAQLGLKQDERFRGALLAANLVGGLTAQKLGLLPGWDMRRIYLWARKMAKGLQTIEEAMSREDPKEVVGLFLNKHYSNTLVINAREGNKLQEMPAVEPRGELLVRYEPNTKRLYILGKAFQQFCVELQINYREITEEMMADGSMLKPTTKRLAGGFRGISAPVHCLVFDGNNKKFLDLDEVLSDILPEDEPSDASGGS